MTTSVSRLQGAPQPVEVEPSAREELDLDGVPAATERLARAFAETAVARDQAGGHAPAERSLIRDSGLLRLAIPRAHGGLGAGWATIYGSIRRLAEVDSALAHVYAFHHLQMASVLLYGDDTQRERHFGATVEQRLFWGNALNPLDTGLVAVAVGDGWRVDGVKSYASGSVGSDRLCLSAHVRAGAADPPSLLVGVLDTRAAGVTVREDWDAFGQRQTDSGTVQFEGVALAGRDVLLAPGAVQSPRETLRSQIAQLILTHLYLGIAVGAFEAARLFTLEKVRPWFLSDVERAVDDPVVQHRYGQLRLSVWPAELAAREAVAELQQALDAGTSLGVRQRGRVAVTAAGAKVLAHRAAIDVSSQMFELTGARSTSARYGFDRYWRNARVHTLHDPVDQKLRDIGRHALEGVLPSPTPYS